MVGRPAEPETDSGFQFRKEAEAFDGFAKLFEVFLPESLSHFPTWGDYSRFHFHGQRFLTEARLRGNSNMGELVFAKFLTAVVRGGIEAVSKGLIAAEAKEVIVSADK
jgi:hypothetical protein